MAEIRDPREKDLYQPVIKALQNLSGKASKQSIFAEVVKLENFSKEELQIRLVGGSSKNKSNRIEYYFGWTLTELKQSGYVDNPSTGKWELTEKGRKVENLTEKEVQDIKRKHMAKIRNTRIKDLYQPIIEALKNLPGNADRQKIFSEVAKIENFSKEELAVRLGGKSKLYKINFRFNWALSGLKRSGYVDNPSKGKWEISEKGRNVEKLTKEEIQDIYAKSTSPNLKDLYKKLVVNVDANQKNVIGGWHTRYKTMIDEVDEVRQRLKLKSDLKLSVEDDKEFLKRLIYLPDNGITFLEQSKLGEIDFNNLIHNENFLNELTHFIIAPSEQGFRKLRVSWKEAVGQGGEVKHSRINRIASACTLDVSSIASHDKFPQLFKKLIEKKIIDKPSFDIEGKEENWFRCNIFLITQIRKIFKEELNNHTIDEIDLNQFVWYLYEYFVGGRVTRIEGGEEESDENTPITESYDLNSISEDGCFIKQSDLKKVFDRLQEKKNLILQGPPGTGKTWLAKRLGYALIGEKDDDCLQAMQFHPNLSYEDFVRGWRPASDDDGKTQLELVDGPFLKMVEKAKEQPDKPFVFVIEEINRGNPAQVFGELLTLIETDKRTPEEALRLSHQQSDNDKTYVPDNLYLIGTMNIADRSLALVDFALRRRFAFKNLEPLFNDHWKEWCTDSGIDDLSITKIKEGITQLNNKIGDDSNLGDAFKIGHSFFTPIDKISDIKKWFVGIAETEIKPLLDEYWFDNPEEATKAYKAVSQRLVTGSATQEITTSDETIVSERLKDKIPIHNLWVLMLYASMLRTSAEARTQIEENPEAIVDLIAEILCQRIEHRLRKNLSFGYRNKSATLSSVRGTIDFLYSERHRLLDRGKIHCRFEALTVDTPRNQYVHASLRKIIPLIKDKNKELSGRCRALATSLERLGVRVEKPLGYSPRNDCARGSIANSGDTQMLAAAELVFNMALPSEDEGRYTLFNPSDESGWLRKLFEKAVFGCFDVCLDKSLWQVSPGTPFHWQFDDDSKTSGINDIFPQMKTDIIITHKKTKKRLIIDTKFTSIIKKGWYRERTLSSNYIYQMYAYIRSQEKDGDQTSQNSQVMLLHPAIGENINESVVIQGHRFHFRTIDLSGASNLFRDQLIEIHKDCFAGLVQD